MDNLYAALAIVGGTGALIFFVLWINALEALFTAQRELENYRNARIKE